MDIEGNRVSLLLEFEDSLDLRRKRNFLHRLLPFGDLFFGEKESAGDGSRSSSCNSFLRSLLSSGRRAVVDTEKSEPGDKDTGSR